MKLKGKKILIFVADIYEDLELHYPRYRLIEEGAEVVVAGEEKTQYKGKHGYPVTAEMTVAEVNVSFFDAVVIPGGYAPDRLRKNPKVIEILKQFNTEKKLIAFICHAGWLPISANILQNVQATSYVAIKDDMVNAGANWVDEAVVVDGNKISSRFPDDLPKFCKAIIDYF